MLSIVITTILTLIVVVVAMNFATPEKKLERRIAHTYSVRDPQFRREMGVLLGPGPMPGNDVSDLQNGDEIFPAMLDAIRAAQPSITLQTCIYWSGKVGKGLEEGAKAVAVAGDHCEVYQSQGQALLATEGVLLTFTPDGITRLAHTAFLVNERTENIGARRLHTVMSTLLEELMFRAPSSKAKKVVFDRRDVQKALRDIVEDEDLSRYIL